MNEKGKLCRKKRSIANRVFSLILVFAMVISDVQIIPGAVSAVWAAESETERSSEKAGTGIDSEGGSEQKTLETDGGNEDAAEEESGAIRSSDREEETQERVEQERTESASTEQEGTDGSAAEESSERATQETESETQETKTETQESKTETQETESATQNTESATQETESETQNTESATQETESATQEETVGSTQTMTEEETTETETTEEEEISVDEAVGETVDVVVHFKNTLNWERVRVFSWIDGVETNFTDKDTGTLIDQPDENGYYSFTIRGIRRDDLNTSDLGILFNSKETTDWGSAGVQTKDIKISKAALDRFETYELWIWLSKDKVESGQFIPQMTCAPPPQISTVDAKDMVTFYYYDLALWDEEAAKGDSENTQESPVKVVGEMNEWGSTNPCYLLRDQDKAGLFSCTIEFAPGGFEYKYIVNGNWINDPSNDQLFGGNNYVGKAREKAKIRFHFKNILQWEHVSLYYWGTNIEGSAWPGKALDLSDANKDDKGYYTVDVDADGLIHDLNFLITNGVASGGLQTNDNAVSHVAIVDNDTYELWVWLDENHKNDEGKYVPYIFTSPLSSPEFGKTDENGTEVTFRYQQESGSVDSVFLAGSMTDWLEQPIEMKQDANGIWFCTIPLQHGEYEYKYVVPKPGETNPGTDGAKYDWYFDPFNTSYSTHEENGEKKKDNSLVYVPGEEYTYTVHYYHPNNSASSADESDLYIWEPGITHTDTAKIYNYETIETDANGIAWLTTSFQVPYSAMGIIARPTAGSWTGQDSNKYYQLKQLRNGSVVEDKTAEFWYIHGQGIYETAPNLGSVTSVSASFVESGQKNAETDMDYTQNKVLHIDAVGSGNAKVLVKEAYVNASALGISEKLYIDPALMEITLSVTQDTPLGAVTLPITVVDYHGNTQKTSATVNVVAKTEAENDFDWDEAVIYFMVTDRFADGDTSNNNNAGAGTFNKSDPGLYHGGDFAGVKAHLKDLKELGVNTIWITPIVENIPKVQVDDGKGDIPNYASYHGYWASDFSEINGALGTKQEFQELIKAVHDEGMKLMVDVVVNHAGYGAEESETFSGMLRKAAIEDDAFHGGGGQAGLPDFMTEYPEIRDMIIGWQLEWANMGVDYFRVDTVKHVDSTTWMAFKNALAKANSDFKMIGEYFDAGYATNNGGTLGSGQMDSLLDFQFNDWAASFVRGGITGVEAELAARNAALNNTYMTGQFLSSHDENGFKYNLKNAGASSMSDTAADAAALVAATLQITAKGQPVIYYGEEIGLTGANDYPRQSNRYDYDWTKANDSNGTYVHYKKMLEIRKNYSAVFARGDRKVVMASNDSGYDVISRSHDNTTLYVGMNIRDAEQTLEIPVKSSGITAYTDVYSGQEYTIAQDKVQVKIPAASKGGTVVLVPSGFSDGLIAPRIVNLAKGKTTSLPSKLTLSKSDGTKTLVDVTYSVQGAPDGVSMDAAGVKITVSEAFQGTQLELEASSSEARVRFTVKVVEDNNKITLRLHYGRKANPNEDLNVWIWRAGKAGERFEVEDDTDPENPNGVVTVGEFEGRAVSSVGYIIRNGGDKGDGVTEDRFIDLSTVLSGTVDFYVTPGKTDGRLVLGEDVFYGTKVRSVTYNRNTNSILVETTEEPVNVNDADLFTVKRSDGTLIQVRNITEKNNTYTIALETDLTGLDELVKSYFVSFEGYDYAVAMPSAYSSEEFERQFTYEGDDLGAVWTKEKTTFKVWAPTADRVQVYLYDKGEVKKGEQESPKEILNMTKGLQGVWSAEKSGDLNGTYYTYNVTVNGTENEACDPYARTTGVNGERAMVIDLDGTNPEGWADDIGPNQGMSYTDSIIYELHVRDFSIKENSGISDAHKGKFLGLTETGRTNGNGQPTGLDYLTDLGVTHIHLLPSYDYATVDETRLDEPQFNWGYDPKNYNVPEGSYSTDPYNGDVRVREMKQMIKTLHDNDINVIMDVVYNHVYDADAFCFNKIVPQYFSRTNKDGSYSNGSGCGNDTASERAMVKKYIVDSVNYWAEEYHIDGFRFDLVGLLDTETINEVVDTVHEKHPNAVFYGEGWTLPTAVSKEGYTMATQANAAETPKFAYFSDTIRDLLKGANDEYSLGFVSGLTGKEEPMANCFKSLAGWSSSPTQIVNYASCHDNYTLMDKLNATAGKTNDKASVIKMNNLAAAIYMTAEGIPLIHAGEEILRTKVDKDGNIIHNSYNSPDYVNQIKWEDLNDPAYRAVRDYYKGLIEFRKNHAALRLTSAKEVEANVKYHWITNEVIMFAINGKDSVADEVSDGIIVIFNATKSDKAVDLYDAGYGIEQGTWKVCINDEKAGTDVLQEITDGKVTVKPISAMVLVKGETVDTDSVYDKNDAENRSRQALQALVERYEELKADDYTAESWQGFEKAFADAKTALEDLTATKEALDTARKNLLEAYDQLEQKANAADFEQLRQMVEKYELLDNTDEKYTADSWTLFEEALAAAKAVLENENASQEEVNAAKRALETAYIGLEKTPGQEPEEPVRTEALENLIQVCSAVEKGTYTDDSWNTFQSALSAAREVLANQDATQAEVDAAVERLQTAYMGLKTQGNAIDRSKLAQWIQTAQGYTEKDSYTEDSWNALQSALTAAQKVYADENATQPQIDEAVNNLMKACGSLTVKPAPEPEEEVKEGLWVKWAPDAGLTHGTDGKYHIQYTGKAIKPTILVYDGKVRLKEKTDYTVTYKANTNAGEASVIVRGKGNYTEARTEHFTIDKVNLAYLEIADLYGAVKANNTKQIAPKPTVKYNGKTLRLNRDYTAAYNNSADGRTPGIYSVKLTANSNNQNFTGSTTIQMILADKDKQVLMSKVRIGKISPQKYEMDKTTGRGKVQKPSVSVKYKGRELTQKDGSKNQESWDYEILWDEIHTEAGETAVITIRGRGTDYVGTKTVSFKISGTPLKASAVTWKSMPKSGLSYNGAKQEPAVEVKGASASQYTVEYTNNINAGTATAVIHGRNGYEGTVKKTFKITAYDLGANTDNRFTFGENRQITTAIPYAKGGSRLDDATLKARFTAPGTERTIPLEQGRDYSLTYTKNKAVGTAAVTIKGKGNFKGTIKKIPFTIVKQNLSALSEMSFAEDLLVKNASKYNRTIPKIIDRDGKALKNKVDFTVDRSTAYKDAGGNPITGSLAVGQVIYVTTKGKGNYEGELSIPFRVIANDSSIAKAVIQVKPQEYTGDEIKPTSNQSAVTVTLKRKENGTTVTKTLTEHVDYEIVGYDNNIKKGTAKITIRGIGAYGGTKTGTFKITAQKMK